MRVWRTISLLYFATYTIVILQFLQGIVLSSPVINRSIRMVREVYPEIETDRHVGNQAEVCIVGDVVYGADEAVPSDQPCLRCKCQPPGVQCEAIQCSQKQGCKTIHKSNQCCPEYQCECVHNGTVYGNGERLATLPGGECSVCYCRGGEVQCANVSCYKRADCEGHTVPGQCCPKYDHCPLKEPSGDRTILHIVPSTTKERESGTTSIYDVQDIKIGDPDLGISAGGKYFPNKSQENNLQSVDSIAQPEDLKIISNITIQEIIPEIKEIPITTAPKQNINVLFTKSHPPVTEAHSNISDNQTNDLVIMDSDTESSEISEIYHHPPPVLKIGDQLLIFKKGELVSEKDISTPVPVITVIGAEGLQRGTEDSSEFHEIFSDLQGPQKDVGSFDDFFDNETSSIPEVQHKETHIISFVKRKSITSTSTLPPATDLPSDLLEFEDVSSESTINITQERKTTYSPTYVSILPHQNTTILNLKDETKSVLKGIETITIKPEVKLPKIQSSDNDIDEKVLDNITNTENLSISKETADNVTQTVQNELLHSELSVTSASQYLRSHFDNETSQTKNPDDTTQATKYLSAHILINLNATLPPDLLKQVAFSDIQDDNLEELENGDTQFEFNHEYNSTDSLTSTSKESIELDSGESTTIPNNHSLEISSIENASIETVYNESRELNTTDMVEILPGFEITTESSVQEKENADNKTEMIYIQASATTTKSQVDLNKFENNSKDDAIFRQLNIELNNTFSSLNFTAFKNEEGAQAIFKELLEEVNYSTVPPHTNSQESSILQLHEKESQLLQRVSEAISKFQSKESKEALNARIVRILKEYFESNKTQLSPVAPTTGV